MSRKYMNDRWCVRCSREGATPFLKKHWPKLHGEALSTAAVLATPILDIGCGNGRNLRYLRSLGFHNVVGFDMSADFGYQLKLGKDRFPLLDHSVSAILANYVFMFLNKTERTQVIRELRRVAKPDCRIMVELYPAKDSEAPSHCACTELQNELMAKFTKNGKCRPIVNNQHRFITGIA